MSTATPLQLLALVYGMRHVFSGIEQLSDNEIVQLHDRLLELNDEKPDSALPEDLCAWAAYNGDDVDALLGTVEEQADVYLAFAREAFQLAKAGMVKLTIEGQLPSDMNELDVEYAANIAE